MTYLTTLQFEVVPSNPDSPLELEVWVDQDKIFDNSVIGTQQIQHKIDDNVDGDHELKIVLKNKTDLHTKIDELGNIVQDSTVDINNVKFDDIDLGYIFNTHSTYTHNRNGHSEPVTQTFFNTMGCNGTVSFKFTTPIYLWLLENM
jgi:hypothetical protein